MSEQEMIYLYKQNNNLVIRDILYAKYKPILLKLTTKWMKQNLNDQSILDINDLISVSYLSFLKTLKTFDNYQAKYSFIQALVVINHANMNHYCRVFWNLRNKIMNNMNYYETEYGEGSYEQMLNNVDLDIKLDKIKQLLITLGEQYWNVFQLKLQGFTIKEIVNQTSLSNLQVSYILKTIHKRFKRSRKTFLSYNG